MVSDVFIIINQALSQVNTWFDQLLNSVGFYPLVIGIIVLTIFFRLIIFPLIGSHWIPRGSDTVSSKPNVPAYKNEASSSYIEDYSTITKGPGAYS